jgi:hypothetical protein
VQDLLNKHIANGFSDFEGLNITGIIPVKQEIINEVIAEFLQSGAQPASPPQPDLDTPSSPGLDIKGLLKLVKKVEVKAADGKVIVGFQIAV